MRGRSGDGRGRLLNRTTDAIVCDKLTGEKCETGDCFKKAEFGVLSCDQSRAIVIQEVVAAEWRAFPKFFASFGTLD